MSGLSIFCTLSLLLSSASLLRCSPLLISYPMFSPLLLSYKIAIPCPWLLHVYSYECSHSPA